MKLLQRPLWRFWDESLSAQSRSALESFATDDTLCHAVGQQLSPPTLRTWVHRQTVVLGIQDHRLPYLEDGMEYLRTQGFTPIVRNSGGLAVVLDDGVLNLSLVFSENEESIDIPAGYEAMVNFVRLILPEVADQIEAYEIVGSYCPGDYDLSIDGKKFAGISQRRIRQGIAVQIYLCVEGSGPARAELVREFYERSLQGEPTKFTYPAIQPEVMASLVELTGLPLTVQDLVVRSYQAIQALAGDVRIQSLAQDEMELYTSYLTRVLERNQKMLAKTK
ncbi:octanoyltransferase [Chryseomicrobium excrementi]|uniref:Octanoyl-[GcvH]:protein N-octanoyltransferase n=1 Tax=Chryseomicrobium excrementi TaxID=2041346 RepID=A0A2M9F005_9BACL|nr:lipoate--protein ligase family protein [Chryseomicrobium excrementi]PJK16801.1 octanoyltransferase [Chryseomicrobium excrementi]